MPPAPPPTLSRVTNTCTRMYDVVMLICCSPPLPNEPTQKANQLNQQPTLEEGCLNVGHLQVCQVGRLCCLNQVLNAELLTLQSSE